MTELEQQQFEAFCKQMQAAGDSWVTPRSAIENFHLDRNLSPSNNQVYAHYHQPTASHLLVFKKTISSLLSMLLNLNIPESIVPRSQSKQSCIFVADLLSQRHFLFMNVKFVDINVLGKRAYVLFSSPVKTLSLFRRWQSQALDSEL